MALASRPPRQGSSGACAGCARILSWASARSPGPRSFAGPICDLRRPQHLAGLVLKADPGAQVRSGLYDRPPLFTPCGYRLRG